MNSRLILMTAGLLACRLPFAAPLPPAASATTIAPAVARPADAPAEPRVQLSPRRFTTLAAEIGAKINALPIREGGAFSAGQMLVGFDCSIQQAQLKKAEAALVAAERTWQANKRLDQLNSVGKVELDLSQSEVEKNKADVAAMAATVSKCRVAAPFSGRIAEQKVREQQYVQPGQAMLDIIDDSSLEVEFMAPSRWLAWLKPGHALSIRIDETGKTYPARIQRIGARVDPVSQSIKVQAAIDGRFPELLAGMSGRASVAESGAK